ncbi:Re/Si-specific NAD(P)(+) transhydrogenase subunit alpha [Thiohalobacter sp. IOR34]|uniref:Re/Si-specific NAD(P)(+) transhydrogenase subunit alpha n=1 Tax=Thiohalobacter sp. IOR34 TaxID=3057176 RepID=UPI0025AF19D6|nr:Re/Si-specific NAD(P)(+) transhydrogenase subunit alpha [Thiohalobacter sp. IOR34]WJW75675.1 Re/Si-specific NAD(P)(+) transhydrogenase subunit alpha [Thiohalobacter sp. IOR34]
MPIRVAVAKETLPGENRVALDPTVAQRFTKLGVEVFMEKGAGTGAHYHDEDYIGVTFVEDKAELLGSADIWFKVQPPTEEEIGLLREGAVLIGMLMPYKYPQRVRLLSERRITSFAMELIPRISRAQSMDVLSSQAAVAGYKASIMAADRTGRFFPMLTTAAGTIRPAKVLVIGAGVAGLQAIATAKRLGAIVEGYDVRSATREQVESLGAKFVDTGVSAEGEGGYARELTEEEKRQQLEVLARHVTQADAVITTAAIPGKPSPKIITAEMVENMKVGSVIIDLAAEGGGNCELTHPGEEYVSGCVTIYGPINVPSMLPVHASEMYAKNLLNFISPMIEEGELKLDWEDEVIRDSVLTHEGEIRHQPTRALVEGEAS